MAYGKGSGGGKINHQAEKSQKVGIDARGGQCANDFVEQPFTPLTDSACERSHAWAAYLKKIPVPQEIGASASESAFSGFREIVH
jgi:hypothetical protein